MGNRVDNLLHVQPAHAKSCILLSQNGYLSLVAGMYQVRLGPQLEDYSAQPMPLTGIVGKKYISCKLSGLVLYGHPV